MLNSISWADYFSTVAFLLLIYYAAIAYLYFKTEVLALVGIKMTAPTKLSDVSVAEVPQTFAQQPDEYYMPKPDADVDLTPVVQSFKDEVSAYTASLGEEKVVREEALHAIELIAAKYPVLNGADCRTELLEHAYSEANANRPSVFKQKDFNHLFRS